MAKLGTSVARWTRITNEKGYRGQPMESRTEYALRDDGVLLKKWSNRDEGNPWYDYGWKIANRTPPELARVRAILAGRGYHEVAP
ncbi:MAG: hypothetical protein ACYDA6_03080 [Solirubrobacteraceae bacterium]